MVLHYAIKPARSPQEIAAVRDLLLEYVRGLNIDVAIKGFEAELPDFPGEYAPPRGDLLLARGDAGKPLGCICVRPLEQNGCCELKRLYVRGNRLGHALASSAVDLATSLGYREAMLDTLPWMTPAIEIYRALGFTPIEPYWNNIVPGIIYFGKRIGGG